MCTDYLNSAMFQDVEHVHTHILFCANNLIENGCPKDSWDYGTTQWVGYLESPLIKGFSLSQSTLIPNK